MHTAVKFEYPLELNGLYHSRPKAFPKIFRRLYSHENTDPKSGEVPPPPPFYLAFITHLKLF